MAPRPGRLLGVDLTDASWHRAIRKQLAPGTTPDPLTVPQGQANELLGSIVRSVADIPAGSTPTVVWTQQGSELLVDTSSLALECTTGLIRIRLDVHCDQLDSSSPAIVPLAVGAPGRPSGLVMSTFTRVDAPAIVADTWSDAITAFAWEALLELARRLCAEVGRDTKGRALIPVDISAARNQLVLTPMARHDITLRGLR